MPPETKNQSTQTTTEPKTPLFAPEHNKKPSSASKNRLPKVLIGIVIIFVALLAIYAVQNKTNTKKTGQDAISIPSQANVGITAAGFNPETIEITAGTQLTWTNSDAAVHQVAADPYPANDSIPGFNSSTILQNNDSVSFTFKEPGTYTYHDERNPLSFKGTVVVK